MDGSSGGGKGNKRGNKYALHGLHHYSTMAGVVGGGERVFAHKARPDQKCFKNVF